MLTHTILAALGPISLGIFLGWISGKTGFIKKEYADGLAAFVVKIALPLALFLAAMTSSPKDILDLNYALAMGIGLILDRKSTRLNSSHVAISYAVFCLKQNNKVITDNSTEVPSDRELRRKSMYRVPI